jgi:Galactose oxidase, central domain
MVVFGGIYEITKELNDLHLFDFKKRRWVTLFEESYSPVRGQSPTGFAEGDSHS